jgi:response regulator RpfG family c-di-GMP phosphodiesterase
MKFDTQFEVKRGELFGFLDPNGAGKTTTARIITVADAYDAMTSLQPYRTYCLSPQQAFNELRRFEKIQFDSELTDLFSHTWIQLSFIQIEKMLRCFLT